MANDSVQRENQSKPQIRSSTLKEKAYDALQKILGSAAEQPLARALKPILDIGGLAGAAKMPFTPPSGEEMAMGTMGGTLSKIGGKPLAGRTSARKLHGDFQRRGGMEGVDARNERALALGIDPVDLNLGQMRFKRETKANRIPVNDTYQQLLIDAAPPARSVYDPMPAEKLALEGIPVDPNRRRAFTPNPKLGDMNYLPEIPVPPALEGRAPTLQSYNEKYAQKPTPRTFGGRSSKLTQEGKYQREIESRRPVSSANSLVPDDGPNARYPGDPLPVGELYPPQLIRPRGPNSVSDFLPASSAQTVAPSGGMMDMSTGMPVGSVPDSPRMRTLKDRARDGSLTGDELAEARGLQKQLTGDTWVPNRPAPIVEPPLASSHQTVAPDMNRLSDRWEAIMHELDAEKAPDHKYQSVLSTGGKAKGKGIKTWRGQLEDFIKRQRVIDDRQRND